MNKIQSFEIFLNEIYNWYYSDKPEGYLNDLSVLKVLKLLFLVTAGDISKKGADGNSLLIDTTFNNFHALPLGPVESDIYAFIAQNNGFENFHLTKSTLSVINPEFSFEVDEAIKTQIEDSVNYLKSVNPLLINLKAFELVDLTHRWASWRIVSNDGKTTGKIPNEIIKMEQKYYY